MSNLDSYVMMGVGGFFVFLGIIAFLYAGGEERSLTESLARRSDLREFVNGWPMRIGPEAIRVGGKILFALGIVLIIVGGIFIAVD